MVEPGNDQYLAQVEKSKARLQGESAPVWKRVTNLEIQLAEAMREIKLLKTQVSQVQREQDAALINELEAVSHD